MIAHFAWQPFFFSASILISAWWRRRVGDELRCSKCDYQVAPEGGRSAACSECGADWNRPGGLVKGRLERNPLFLGLGSASSALCVLMFASSLSWRHLLLLYPTRVLIHQIVEAPRGFVVAEWAELNGRTLTGEQEIRLAEGLLQKRLRKGYLSSDGDTWLQGAIAAGRLPRSLVRRYDREAFDFRLIAPDRVKTNEDLRVQVEMIDRLRVSSRREVHFFVGGFYVGESTEPIGRRRQPISIYEVAARRRRGETGVQSKKGDLLELTLTPDQAGQLRIRLVFWMVVTPPGTTFRRIKWKADGQPVIPSKALRSERFELEHTLEVVASNSHPPGVEPPGDRPRQNQKGVTP